MYMFRTSLVCHQRENQIAARLVSTLGHTSSWNVSKHSLINADVLLTVHLSIILEINQPNAQILVL